MAGRRRLIPVAGYGAIAGTLHQVEGTRLHIMEMLTFGFDHASLWVLLRSNGFLSRLDDPQVAADFGTHPHRYGRLLAFGPDLDRDPQGGAVCYVGPVAPRDLLPPAAAANDA